MSESLLYISVSSVDPSQKDTYPDVAALTSEFMRSKPLSKEAIQKVLQAYALAGTHPEIMRLLIDHGADVNHSYTGGDKLLRMAHKNDNTDVITLLLEKYAALTPSERDLFTEIAPDFANSKAFAQASENFKIIADTSKPEI